MKLIRPRFKSDNSENIIQSLNISTPEQVAPVRRPKKNKKEVLSGVVRLSFRDFGFVNTESGQGHFISRALAKGLVEGDIIQFSVEKTEGLPGRDYTPAVEEIQHIKRRAGVAMCEISPQTLFGSPVFADSGIFMPIYLESIKGVAPGDVVVVEYPGYEGNLPDQTTLNGTIIANLGKRNLPSAAEFQFNYAKQKYQFASPFPEGVEKEVTELLSNQELGFSSQEHLDLTHIPFVTIDGKDTLDLDDAVYCAKMPQEGWLLRVAIADVSYFVKPGTLLDKTAKSRGISLYLPGETVPMFPAELSNGLFSLLPSQPVPAAVITMWFDNAGRMYKKEINRAMIKSVAKLTYEEVTQLIEQEFQVLPEIKRELAGADRSLAALNELSQVINRDRAERGVMEFNEPNIDFKKEKDGQWLVKKEPITAAHRLIESLMVMANTAAGELLIERYGRGIFRVQPAPSEESWQVLGEWAQSHGKQLGDEKSLLAMANLKYSFPQSEQGVIESKLRFAMQLASYKIASKDEEASHFALNTQWYAQFTSPIRRCADLLVHRLLLAPEGYVPTEEEWQLITQDMEHLSHRNALARLAEKSVRDAIKLQSLLQTTSLGEECKAKVVRVAARGVRVSIEPTQSLGWLPAEDMEKNGFICEAGIWRFPENGSAGKIGALEEGHTLSIRLKELKSTNPALLELIVTLSKSPTSKRLEEKYNL